MCVMKTDRHREMYMNVYFYSNNIERDLNKERKEKDMDNDVVSIISEVKYIIKLRNVTSGVDLTGKLEIIFS